MLYKNHNLILTTKISKSGYGFAIAFIITAFTASLISVAILPAYSKQLTISNRQQTMQIVQKLHKTDVFFGEFISLLSTIDITAPINQQMLLTKTKCLLETETDSDILMDVALSIYYKESAYSMCTQQLEFILDKVFWQCIDRIADDPSRKATLALSRIFFLCRADGGIALGLHQSMCKQLGYNKSDFSNQLETNPAFRQALEDSTLPSKRH